MNRSSLTRFAWLSIAAAVLTIGLKAIAYQLTGSVGLLSDALEIFRQSCWCADGISYVNHSRPSCR